MEYELSRSTSAAVRAATTRAGKRRQIVLEGCLSFPLTSRKILRHKKIFVAGFGVDWKPLRLTVSGYNAAIIQHEINHLDGITISNNPDALPLN